MPTISFQLVINCYKKNRNDFKTSENIFYKNTFLESERVKRVFFYDPIKNEIFRIFERKVDIHHE